MDAEGTRFDSNKVEAIFKQLHPIMVIKVQAFLGAAGFFKKYI